MSTEPPTPDPRTIEQIAQIIRASDGAHKLGASAQAECIVNDLTTTGFSIVPAARIEQLEAERREQAVRLTEMERRYSMLRHRARLINDQTQALAELLCPIESAPIVEDTP